jgi:hypothetical protein
MISSEAGTGKPVGALVKSAECHKSQETDAESEYTQNQPGLLDVGPERVEDRMFGTVKVEPEIGQGRSK